MPEKANEACEIKSRFISSLIADQELLIKTLLYRFLPFNQAIKRWAERFANYDLQVIKGIGQRWGDFETPLHTNNSLH